MGAKGAGSLGDGDMKCRLYQEACGGLDRDTGIIWRRSGRCWIGCGGWGEDRERDS